MDDILRYFFNAEVARATLPGLLAGFVVTVRMAALAVVLGILGGLVIATLRAYRVPVLDQALVLFMDFFRAVPSLVVLVMVYFGLPYVGISLSGEGATILGLGLVLSAYAAEIFWAGIKTVPLGQWEAGLSTGLGFSEVLAIIVMPRALRMGIPVLTNRTIAVAKGTAYGAIISAEEILSVSLSAQQTHANPTPLVLGAALYLVVFIPLVQASRWIERSYAIRH
jgi:polar amino acid transport system permease protein